MFTASPSHRRPGFILALLCICCLPIPGRGDEMQYLPDNPQLIASLDMVAYANAKTPFLKELGGKLREVGDKIPDPEESPLEIGLDKIARITLGLNLSEEPPEFAFVYTTIKPASVAEIKAARKPHPNRKNAAYKEIKIGAVTVYQQTYQYRKQGRARPRGGGGFCVLRRR